MNRSQNTLHHELSRVVVRHPLMVQAHQNLLDVIQMMSQIRASCACSSGLESVPSTLNSHNSSCNNLFKVGDLSSNFDNSANSTNSSELLGETTTQQDEIFHLEARSSCVLVVEEVCEEVEDSIEPYPASTHSQTYHSANPPDNQTDRAIATGTTHQPLSETAEPYETILGTDINTGISADPADLLPQNSPTTHHPAPGITLTFTKPTPQTSVASPTQSVIRTRTRTKIVGILTERDIVRLSAQGHPLVNYCVGDVVHRNIVTLPEAEFTTVFRALSLLNEYQIRHLPLVDADGQPTGLVTHETLRLLSRPSDLLRLQTVQEVMVMDVVRAHPDLFVTDIAQLLATHKVSCVVLTEGTTHSVRSTSSSRSSNPSHSNPSIHSPEFTSLPQGQSNSVNSSLSVPGSTVPNPISNPKISDALPPIDLDQDTCDEVLCPPRPIPVGLITERDLVQLQALELDTRHITARMVMSSPVFTTTPNSTLLPVHELMSRHGIRRVVVTDEWGGLVGLVTQTCLLNLLNPLSLYQQVEDLGRKVLELQAEKEALETQVAQATTSQIKQTNQTAQTAETQTAPQVAKTQGQSPVSATTKQAADFRSSLEREPLFAAITARTTAELRSRIEREQLVLQIATQIHQSLNLADILNTTVQALRSFLECDRVVICRLEAGDTWMSIAESKTLESQSLLYQAIQDRCVSPEHMTWFQAGNIRTIDDITQADLTPCHRELLEGLDIRSKVLVPIVLNEEVWGFVLASYRDRPYPWTANQIATLRDLAVQLGIAVNQATVYEKLQQDLAERIQLEEEREQSEQRLKEAQRIARVGDWQVDLATGHITWSDEIFRMLGIEPQSVTPSIDLFLKFVHPDDRFLVENAYHQAQTTGKPCQLEHRFLMPNGLVKYAYERCEPQADEFGIYCLRCTTQDITQMRESTNALLAQIEFSDAIISSLPGIFYLFDEAGNLLRWNLRYLEVLGYSVDEVAHLNLRQMITPAQQAIVWQQFQNILEDNRETEHILDTVLFTKTGQDLPYQMTGRRVSLSGRTCVVGCGFDIGERKRAETALQSLIDGTAGVTGTNFFPELVSHIAQAFGVDQVVVSEMKKTSFSVITEYRQGRLQPSENTLLLFKDALPCLQALKEGVYYLENLPLLYNLADHPVLTRDAYSYLGLGLYNSHGESIGTLFLTHHAPIARLDEVKNMLRAFAARAGAEIERLHTARDLKRLNVDLEARVERRTTQLREQASQIRALTNNIPGVVWQVLNDEHWTFRFVSDAIERITGYPATEFRSGQRTLEATTHPDDRATVRAAIQACLSKGDTYNVEFRLQHRDGSYRWMQESGQGAFDERGQLLWIDAIALDITEARATQDALNQTESRYQALMDGAGDAILLTNLDGTVLEVNHQAQELTGYSREQLTTLPFWSLFTVDDRDRIAETFQQLNTGQSSSTLLDMDWYDVNNATIPVDISSSLIQVGQESIVLSIVRDIRDRKAIEAQLHANAHRLSTAHRIAELGSWELEVETGQVTWSTNTGLTLEDPPTTYQDFLARMIDSDRGTQHQLFMTTITTGQPYDSEFAVLRPNGERRYLAARGEAILNDQGQTVRIIGTVVDITARKLATRQLQELTDRLQLSLQAGDIGCWEWDINTDELTWDARMYTLYGYPQPEDRMHNNLGLEPFTVWSQTLHPEDQEATKAALFQSVQDRKDFNTEFRIQRPDGKIRYIKANGLVQYDAAGEPLRMFGVNFDITDRRLSEERLKRSNAELERATRLKDEFLANMSHELRTPLNAILGMSEGLQEQVFGEINDRQSRAIQTIDRSGRHLLALINDILDLSKIESGKVELNYADASLTELCQASLAFVKQLAYKKQIHLTTEIPASLNDLKLHVDERRIRQVLINLLSNAVKFTPDRGKISLAVEIDRHPQFPPTATATAPAAIVFAVTDNGIGISPENQKRLFQSFVQIDSSLNRQYNGTGLGLALVKGIAELHGGWVSLESAEGCGSCFRVHLPLQQPEALNALPPLPSPTIPENNRRVMIIEDSETAAEQVDRYLRDLGFEPSIYGSGEAAIADVDTLKPGLIILDIQLPEQLGWDVLTEFKRHPSIANVPIVVSSVVDERSRGLNLGVTEYLLKPIEREHFDRVIQALQANPSPAPVAENIPKMTTILLAEDNQANIETMTAYLESRGYHMVLASNGRLAVELAQSEAPDIILMDIQMPEMDGFEAIRQIRQIPGLADLPIVALTALAMESDRRKCIDAGANEYLSKPVKLRQLVETIQTLVKR